MHDHLQITFIPTIDGDRKFFIWLTDEDGKPKKRKSGGLYNVLRSDTEWREAFHLEPPIKSEATFQVNSEMITTPGLLFSMNQLFRVFRHPSFNKEIKFSFIYGETVPFFREIAGALKISLENGQFYPAMYNVEKEGETYFFSQWLPVCSLYEQSGLMAGWLKQLPPVALSAEILSEIKVMQWLHLLISYWTDAIIRQTAGPAFDSVIDEWQEQQIAGYDSGADWFHQLISTEPGFVQVSHNVGEINALQALESTINSWTAAISKDQPSYLIESLKDFKQSFMRPHITPEELSFRFNPENLEDPFERDSPWHVDLVVNGQQNGRSGVFSLDDILSGNPRNLMWFFEKLEDVRGAMPGSIARELYVNSGESMVLSTEDVYEFYRNESFLNDNLIVLSFPSWMEVRKSDEGIDMDLEIDTKSSMFSLSSIINYNWRISVGDLSLSAEEFKQLVKQQRPFIKRGNEWIQLPFEQMLAAYGSLDETELLVGSKPRVLDALRLTAARRRKRKKDVNLKIGASLENYLTALFKKPTKNLTVPLSFKGELRPYQKTGFTWLAHLEEKGVGGCLADDMGLGKTIQTIAYLARILDQKKGPALIICPTSLMGNWMREINSFAPNLRVYSHHGTARYSSDHFQEALERFDIIITSYTLFTREIEHLSKYVWSSAVLDEAQAIKNPQTKKSRAVRQINARHRVVLTGTPIENRLEELWSIMEFLNPGYLGSLKGFREKFARPIEKNNDQAKAKLLTQMIQPFLLRREKTDKRIIKDLPEKQETKELCYLSKAQATLYQSVVDQLVQKVSQSEGMKRKGMILSTLTKLKQVCDHPSLVADDTQGEDSGKMTRLFEIVDALFEKNEKVLVFTQYVKMGKLLIERVAKRHSDAKVFFLHGSLTPEKREKMIRAFRSNENEKTLFVLSLKAGGLGLNLTEANHVIHYDRWWNPAVEDQATDRAYRIGQHRNVQVHKLICEGTLEQRIDELIEKKKGLSKQILGKGEGWITELTDKEIYELIRLREKVMS
ncbi:SNF2 family DNA or RNA helicase [Scopulibacillus darangshiensis]|uniref:SNF2 family DNA or RNA helicase n=1 Tax=Scopulibacillus darangshiensis TaxID=442528 RepID=A0A4R2P2G6_9BACL|nr:DEAD/DEAH box helicase [Scopulibacillus darangshiensis]TCP28919.1 SNF2 family DNA or RNA helicase [Scopulibacillus darangshiensis]